MFGYGPRYLHSTGQLHKGGANNGVFLVVTAAPREDVPIPGEAFSFATLELAQAIGDFQSLDAAGRRAMHVAPASRGCRDAEDALRTPAGGTLMRYLVTARVKPGQEEPLRDAIADGTLGRGSVAGDEYVRNMHAPGAMTTAACDGSRSASVRRRSRKNGSTGRNTSRSRKCRTPTRAAAAAI